MDKQIPVKIELDMQGHRCALINVDAYFRLLLNSGFDSIAAVLYEIPRNHSEKLATSTFVQ